MKLKLGVLAAVAAGALVLAGQAPAANFVVWAGPGFLKAAPPGAPQQGDANLFFPRKVQVHVGDTVTFKSDGFHTATYLGSHKGSEFQIFVPAADKSLYAGINDAAGAPFWFNGQTLFQYNIPQVFLPVGSAKIAGGTAVHSSGILDKKGYPFKFTKPGDYVFRCLIHSMMSVHVIVKAKTSAIQPQAKLLAATAAELSAAVTTAKALDTEAPSAPNTVYAGVGKAVAGGSIEIMGFRPAKLTVKVGTTVTWQLHSPMEIHDMVFGAPDYLDQSFKTLDLIPQAPGAPNQVWPFFFYGSDPLGTSGYQYDGTNHGNGFLATPVMGPPGTPLPKSFQITFTAPGTFKYICGIHGPDMNGEIDVIA